MDDQNIHNTGPVGESTTARSMHAKKSPARRSTPMIFSLGTHCCMPASSAARTRMPSSRTSILTKAQALPGVKAVVTGEDFPGYIGLYLQDRFIFCRDRVRYVGDPVAGVAATSEEIAQKALDLIDVEYEVLAPVLDPEFGASSEAPILHPDLGKYVVAGFIFPEAGNEHLQSLQAPQRRCG